MTDCYAFYDIYQNIKRKVSSAHIEGYAANSIDMKFSITHSDSEKMEDIIAILHIDLGTLLQAVQDCHRYEVK
jgi:hypothetical protein